jgi:hypothetical protein
MSVLPATPVPGKVFRGGDARFPGPSESVDGKYSRNVPQKNRLDEEKDIAFPRAISRIMSAFRSREISMRFMPSVLRFAALRAKKDLRARSLSLTVQSFFSRF